MFMSRGRPVARQPCRTGPGSHGMVQENLGLRLIFLKVNFFFEGLAADSDQPLVAVIICSSEKGIKSCHDFYPRSMFFLLLEFVSFDVGVRVCWYCFSMLVLLDERFTLYWRVCSRRVISVDRSTNHFALLSVASVTNRQNDSLRLK